MIQVPVEFILNIASQCDLQKKFMDEAEMEIGTPEAIRLAVSLVEEEVAHELLPAVQDLLTVMTLQSTNTRSNPMALAAVRQLDEEYENTLTEVADGIVDSIYVLMQLANTLSLPFDPLFLAVHENNMSKLQKGEDGKLLKRWDGKILKPEGYKKVDLKGIIFPSSNDQLGSYISDAQTEPPF